MGAQHRAEQRGLAQAPEQALSLSRAAGRAGGAPQRGDPARGGCTLQLADPGCMPQGRERQPAIALACSPVSAMAACCCCCCAAAAAGL